MLLVVVFRFFSRSRKYTICFRMVFSVYDLTQVKQQNQRQTPSPDASQETERFLFRFREYKSSKLSDDPFLFRPKSVLTIQQSSEEPPEHAKGPNHLQEENSDLVGPLPNDLSAQMMLVSWEFYIFCVLPPQASFRGFEAKTLGK